MSYMEDEYYDEEDYNLSYEDDQTGQQTSNASKGVEIFTTLSANEVLKELHRDVQKTNEILGLTPEAAMLVLRRYGWKMDDATLEKYLNDMDRINKELEITDFINSNDDCKNSFYKEEEEENVLVRSDKILECPICGDDIPAGESISLIKCKHFFCVDCLTSNLLCALKHYQDLINKRCPMRGCYNIIGLNIFKKLLSPRDYGQVQRRFLSEYLSSHTHMRCCPNELSCEGVIRVNILRESGPDVSCHICGLNFCFKCLKSPHSPATCEMLRRWDAMVRKNEPSLALIQMTTKGCPKCGVRVEKNQGCNHMICAHCQYEYCWVCLGPWSEHNSQFYNCNRKVNDDKVKDSEQLLFLHCFERWDNHKRSIMLETKSLQEGLQSIRKLAEYQKNASMFDKTLSILLSTQQVLHDCRIVLMNGYIALFCGGLKDTSFHYRIHQLELRTEETSKLIDASPELLDGDEIQNRASQATHWCNVLRKDGLD